MTIKNNFHFWDSAGFFLLCVVFMALPFHAQLIDKFRYYQEFFALFFISLIIMRSRRFFNIIIKRRELFYTMLLIPILIFAAMYDEGISLYSDYFSNIMTMKLGVDLRLYIIRNAVLYIPMIVYLSMRGCSHRELRTICFIVTAMFPCSLYFFLHSNPELDKLSIELFTESGGVYFERNTFIPYLTFPLITTLYLITESKNTLYKSLLFSVAFALLIIIVLSLSRQSVFFAFVIIFIYMYYFILKGKWELKTFILTTLTMLCLYISVVFIMDNYYVSDRYANWYSSIGGFFETDRHEIMTRGLELLSPIQFIFGAGLTSVIHSGPHNDYIRWIQRIGITGMIICFLPFLISLRNSRKFFKKRDDLPLKFLISTSLLFTLYHSFFSYPRETVYTSAYCFLGLGLWMAVSKEMSVPHHNNINLQQFEYEE